jgi:hypothetical protein
MPALPSGNAAALMAKRQSEDEMNLLEIMNQAQGGEAFSTLARQFGLSDDQAQSAVQAMMPAFATGLKRNTADPTGMMNFMKALAGGNHANYFDNADTAISGGGIADGNAILGHLFGSKEVSRAVASQAQAATGIGENVLKQMLPALASMVMGGLSKQSRSGSDSALGDIMNQMAETFGGAAGEPGDGPLDRYEKEKQSDNPLGRMMGEMMGGGADNPLGRMFEQFTGGASGGETKAPTGKDVFGELFEPGRQMGEAYQKNMDTIFDQFLSGMDKRRP